VLPVVARAAAKLLARRLAVWVEKTAVLGSLQWGFRVGRSTVGAQLVLVRLAEEARRGCWAPGVAVAALLDLRTACAKVVRNTLWTLLRRLGLPEHVLQTLQRMHDGVAYSVRVGGATARPYQPARGLREGCPTSPVLFNVYHAAVLHDFTGRRERLALERGVQCGLRWCTADGEAADPWTHVLFADDTTLLGTQDELDPPPPARGALELFAEVLQEWGGEENQAKRAMVELRAPPAGPAGRFLGMYLHSGTQRATKARKAWVTAKVARRVLAGVALALPLRWQVFRALAESAVLFGAETATLGPGGCAALDRWQGEWARAAARTRRRDLPAAGGDTAAVLAALGGVPLSLVAVARALKAQNRVWQRPPSDPERRALSGRGPAPQGRARRGWPLLRNGWAKWAARAGLRQPAPSQKWSAAEAWAWETRAGQWEAEQRRRWRSQVHERVRTRDAWRDWVGLPSVAANVVAPRRPRLALLQWFRQPWPAPPPAEPVTCGQCPRQFADARAAAAHARAAHADSGGPCDVCGRHCATATARRTHQAACERWARAEPQHRPDGARRAPGRQPPQQPTPPLPPPPPPPPAPAAPPGQQQQQQQQQQTQQQPQEQPQEHPQQTAQGAGSAATPAQEEANAGGADGEQADEERAEGAGAEAAPAEAEQAAGALERLETHAVWGLPWRPGAEGAWPWGGPFECACGRRYKWPQGLRRHWSAGAGCAAQPDGRTPGRRGRPAGAPPPPPG
jgi:hypothetical protein